MQKNISILIKPASSLCNLKCKYCFYADVSSLREVKSYGRMKLETVDALIKNVFIDLNDGDQLTIAFQGGEPTLAGLRYYQYFLGEVEKQTKKVFVHYAIQTNGMLINDAWCHLLKEHNFLVGLSIDGTLTYHDWNRVDARGHGTFSRVMRTKEMLDQHGIDYNVLCVLTNPLAKHAKKVFDFFQQNHVKYVQFIPCLDEMNADHRSAFALVPERFATFYQTYFRLWLSQLQRGKYQSVKIFDDIMNQFGRGLRTACGLDGQCQVQYIIEADGSVYPCDFFAVDQYRLGYIQDSTLKELFCQPITLDFLRNKRKLPLYCGSCPFKQYCCGGCRRMKDAMYVNRAGNFCGYRQLLTTILSKKEMIIREISSARFAD
ncbi:radical SAM/SPASM domain-containing protein [Lacticaseibacillus rhamnosus]|uniref:radical SAM/SPASM domain-containing protein n=1 Tax=Lacticaseibacillus rhamnosus TaxID=47715 RepID=UPI0008A261DC|nr:radical SAM protein [Lacticaseibacillus rhamnosus]MDK7182416.1 SPASM domain-containing protein [Lacticaseibacillus rhamnosus]MDK7240393.1 SPASM domain-containing protein [Lacticaseibacillus rhamnosus]MDT8863563.1 SPASM domain-containing protein [Lacticaseibacillus rhamnosus]OFN10321.1 radical SAM/SPASM domain-containing protein [Lactobacillus sp. HMSC072E07]